MQEGVGGSHLWDLADATTNSAGCWLNHALATEINRTCNVCSAFSALEEQRLYSMKVLLQSQPPTSSSSSSSFGRQNVVKRNFDFILVTAQTHGFQKTVMFKRESLHPSFALTISISCTSFSLPGAVCYQATVLEGGSSSVAYARQAALSFSRACGREKLLPQP